MGVSSQGGEATARSLYRQMPARTGEEGIEMRMRIDSLINLTRNGMIECVNLGGGLLHAAFWKSRSRLARCKIRNAAEAHRVHFI